MPLTHPVMARFLARGQPSPDEVAYFLDVHHFPRERSCTIRDPFGHEWMLGHEIEKVEPEEMQRRYTAMFE